MNPISGYKGLMVVMRALGWCGVSAYNYDRGFIEKPMSYRAYSSKPKRSRHPRHDRAKAKPKPRHHRHFKRAA